MWFIMSVKEKEKIMLVNFNPAISNRKSDHPAFKAVNQEWLAKIKRNVDFADNDFRFGLLAGEIPKKDYIDTLEAAKKHYAPKFQEFFEDTIQWATKFTPKKPETV